jgi:hypothetical protein
VFVALSLDWRRGVVALLVAAIRRAAPVFVAGTPGLAFRDCAVVAPLYIAFAMAMLRSNEPLLPPLGMALPALAIFAMLAAAQAMRAPSLSVGVLGLKVWLAYVPMLAVGYHYVRRARDLDRVLAMTALLGLAPAALALAEWFTSARTGSFGPFAHIYGAGSSVPPILVFGDGDHLVKIARIPSTFTSGSSYYLFAVVAYTAALSQLLSHGGRGWFACAVVLAAGAMASGNRAAYAMVRCSRSGRGARRRPAVEIRSSGRRPARWWCAGRARRQPAAGGEAAAGARLRHGLDCGWHEMRSQLPALRSWHRMGCPTPAHRTATRASGATSKTGTRRRRSSWDRGAGDHGRAANRHRHRALAPLRRLDAGRGWPRRWRRMLGADGGRAVKGPYIDL